MSTSSTNTLADALRDWTEALMHRSMQGFLAYAKEHNLSMSQIGALFHVHRHGACGVSAISDDLGVTNAAVSQMLDRLVDGELVIRQEDPTDRRSKRIQLTQKGEEVLRGTMELRYGWFRSLAGSLTEEERATAVQTLRTLTAHALELQEFQS